MQRVQRKFGTFLKRSEDEADVGTVLKEYEDTDKFLTTFISHGQVWRDAWKAILQTQLSTTEVFDSLCQPIGADENVKHISAATPEGSLTKTHRLGSAYSELNVDLTNEISSIDTKLIRPAAEAKDSLKNIRKVIKKREDRKLDYERYHSRAENARRKETKSPKDEAALMRYESDLAAATEEYQNADEQIKRCLPPILDAIASLLPYLLSAQIMLQHSLVAHLYTTVYEYCTEQGFSPTPVPLETVVSDWDASFTPLRMEAESGLELLVNNKAVHQPMELPESRGQSVTGLSLRSKFADRRKSSTGSGSFSRPSVPSFFQRGAKEDEEKPPTRPLRPSVGSTPPRSYIDDDDDVPPGKPPRPSALSSPTNRRISSSRTTPSGSSPGTPYETVGTAFRRTNMPFRNGGGSVDVAASNSNSVTPSRASPGNDYFGKVPAASVASGVAAKKKPPPPPPTKRKPSIQGQFVTALYDFTGQNPGDLSFQEGQRIRVIKKTESMNDWWEGEISGVKGSFPANYVQI